MERRRGRARHVSALWRGGMRRGCGVWAVSEASRKGRLERRPRRPDDDDCGDGDDDVGGDDDSFDGRDDAPKDKCAVGVGLALVPAGQRAQLDAKQRVALDVLRADGAVPKRGADNEQQDDQRQHDRLCVLPHVADRVVARLVLRVLDRVLARLVRRLSH